MDFEYLDAFARPSASKGYEKKPSIQELLANLAKTEAAALAAEQKFSAAADTAVKQSDLFAKTVTKEKSASIIVAVPETPAIPAATTIAPTVSKIVKTAPIDTVLFNDDSVPVEVMTDLIFENIGGHELINIARNDIVNGQTVSYQPIKNLSSIQQQYNPNNILGLQNTSDKYFANFSIKLENKIPNAGSGPNGSNVYLENTTGNLVIETVTMANDEQIEVEITVSGIIYEAEFGEIIS
jgi:hypothetical protein